MKLNRRTNHIALVWIHRLNKETKKRDFILGWRNKPRHRQVYKYYKNYY